MPVQPIYQFETPDHRTTITVRETGVTPETRMMLIVPRDFRFGSGTAFGLSEFFSRIGDDLAQEEAVQARADTPELAPAKPKSKKAAKTDDASV
jgi:hypothetical protein